MNQEANGGQEPPPQAPRHFRWTERRAASAVSMIVSGAVVVADFALLLVFIRVASNLPGGWGAYWYIPAGIAAVFVYALRRFLRQVRQFRRDE